MLSFCVKSVATCSQQAASKARKTVRIGSAFGLFQVVSDAAARNAPTITSVPKMEWVALRCHARNADGPTYALSWSRSAAAPARTAVSSVAREAPGNRARVTEKDANPCVRTSILILGLCWELRDGIVCWD